MWSLTIEDEQGVTTRVALARDLYLVGRDPACDICLLDRNVSRRHAVLRALPEGGWEILDRSSRYGSLLNGRRLRVRAALASGDAVQIGGYRFALSGGAAAFEGEAPGGDPARPSGPGAHATSTLDGQVQALGDGAFDAASVPFSLSRLPASSGALVDDAFPSPSAAPSSVSVAPPVRRGAAARFALPATLLLVAMGAGASLSLQYGPRALGGAASGALEGRAARPGPAVALSLGATGPSASAKPAPCALTRSAPAAPKGRARKASSPGGSTPAARD